MVNTSQQVGGSVGASLLSTLFASAAASFLRAHPGGGGAAGVQIHGYSVAFWWATAIFAVGLAASVAILPARSRLVFAVAQPAPAIE